MYEFVHRRVRLHGFWRVLMRIDADPVCDTLTHFGIVTTVSWLVVLAGFLTVGFAPPAQALPSFARQTGQPCGTCHTDFAGLTPFGRRFKIGGYTYGGGAYRTARFSLRRSLLARRCRRSPGQRGFASSLSIVAAASRKSAARYGSPASCACCALPRNLRMTLPGSASFDFSGLALPRSASASSAARRRRQFCSR